MIDIDIDSFQFGGFKGKMDLEESQSRFTIKMHAVPRVGEILYVAQSLVPPICLTGPYASTIELDGQKAGYLQLEVVTVSHKIDKVEHRPYVFCRAPYR